jgi:dihydroorotase
MAERAMGERTVALRGGTVIDEGGIRRADIIIEGDHIVAVGPDLSVPAGAVVLEAGGCLVTPGLVDLHTHLREPGREEAETVDTGSRAAALGGYTALVAMPNTQPAIDNAGTARQVLDLGRGALCEIAVAGAITLDRAGERLAPMAELAALGIELFTDDGTGVQDGGLMRRALDYARGLGVTLAQHCEDSCLVADGVMHEGAWSSRLGLAGVPAAAEEAMVARDLALVRLTQAPMHFLHLSTAGSVALVRAAKAEGLAVSAEAAPHHFVLTDAEVATYDPVFKVNPPLRTASDVAAIRVGLCDGTIDAVATDHAPHAPEAKDVPFDEAPPGMLGLETALNLAFETFCLPLDPDRATSWGNDGPPHWSLVDLFGAFCWRPARIAKLGPEHRRLGGHSAQGGPLAPGSVGNVCVFDPSATFEIDAMRLASKSRNTPYAGRKLTGRVRHTVLRGEPVVIDAEAQR